MDVGGENDAGEGRKLPGRVGDVFTCTTVPWSPLLIGSGRHDEYLTEDRDQD